MPQENAIEFKGTKKGIYVQIKPHNDFETLKLNLIEKLEKTKTFFSGAKILDIQCNTISLEEKEELEKIMSTRYQMQVQREEFQEDPPIDEVFQGINEGMTKFIPKTLRSGQKINYKGNVVIFGDVNPGAEIIAYGNIVVLGSLRGIAHAGSNGNKYARVVAYYLDPTQLRIADKIARSPDGEYEKPKGPELACIKDEVVYIEPFLTKR
ncbi:septum site-determining protein MinC [Alkaliphilus hydrothermalis]|uniref:Probable septum site-determining protein MinC n=1 Tax=Alkaliphilus hydrothermalis TaxID=1482730 RepID=A0ABS2NKX1_9FIRM|nr:septum site-determining protein MinC [Alkaliphilus hydrothermalis]MBM7613582.1 septum site-determining protein MinC [Alkaliphilus hydrothermalis]